MKKISITLLLTALLSVNLFGQVSEITLDTQKGEAWWIVAFEGNEFSRVDQPFARDYSGKCSALVMLSSTGRYIYAADPLRASYDGKTFSVSAMGHTEKDKGGKSIREAYILCRHKNFPPDGNDLLPSAERSVFYNCGFIGGGIPSQNELLEYCELLSGEGMPRGMMVIPDGWQSVNTYGADRNLYPDPSAMARRAGELGFDIRMTVTPLVPVYGRNAGGILESSRLVKDSSGQPVIYESPMGKQYVLDLSDSLTLRDFLGRCHALLDDVYGNRLVFSSRYGADFQAVSIRRAVLKNFSVEDFTTGGSVPADDPILFVIREAIMSAMTNPVPTPVNYFFKDTARLFADDDLMAKYLLLQSILPYGFVDFHPDRIGDPQLRETVKASFKGRSELRSYIENLGAESARTGEPLIRHMEYQFPRTGFADCDDQFMIGPRYLIAPGLAGKDTRMVRIPKGTWISNKGERVKGPVVIEADCRGGNIPVYTLQGK